MALSQESNIPTIVPRWRAVIGGKKCI